MNTETAQAYTQALIDTQAIQIRSISEEPFTLRSGRKSYIYVDHAKIAHSPKTYKAFIDAVKDLLETTYGQNDFVLCNVDSKISSQMVGSLAYTMNKPQIIFKSKELAAAEKGAGEQLTGDKQTTVSIAIIDDVMTGGDGTATNVAKLVRQEFPDVTDIQIFTGLRRNQQIGSTEFPMHSVLCFDDVIEMLGNSLSNEQKQAIEKEKTLNS